MIMSDYNVLVTARERAFGKVCEILESIGTIRPTKFFNVLLMKVDDIDSFIASLDRWTNGDGSALKHIARIAPLTRTFHFDSPDKFEMQAHHAVLAESHKLAGKSFHVRFHRRGFKGHLSTPGQERALDHVLIKELQRQGKQGRIRFDDSDMVILIETAGNWGGISTWSREQIQRYPFLGVD